MSKPQTAIVLTECYAVPGGMEYATRPVTIPVSRIAKSVGSGLTRNIIKGAYPESWVELRTPQDFLHIKETCAEIADRMNGEVKVSGPTTYTHGMNIHCPDVVSGRWAYCKGHQDTTPEQQRDNRRLERES
jgi:hypothetical protein